MTSPPPPRDQDASKPDAPRSRGRLLAVAVAAVIGLVAAAWGGAHLWRQGETRQRPPASTTPVGGAFSLIDPAGRPITDRDIRGHFMLIYFGYTTCRFHCPTMLTMTAAALDSLGPRAGEVQAIFITVDPQHDTPEIMGRYTNRFGQRILGLTGSPDQIEAVEKAYGVQTLYRRTGPEALDYVIDHPSIAYLVGPDGRFIAELGTEGRADELAAQIRRRF